MKEHFVIFFFFLFSVGMASVTLSPTCAGSFSFEYSISTIDTILTLNIDSSISDFDQIIMMPPSGKDLKIAVTIDSDLSLTSDDVIFTNTTHYTTHSVGLKLKDIATTSTTSSTTSTTAQTGTGSIDSASHKIRIGAISSLMGIIVALAVMLRVRPSFLIMLVLCCLCMGVWAACTPRATIKITAPSTVHTICFKGLCHCNCVPKGCGVNIHFTQGSTAVVNSLGSLQTGVVRMDMIWSGIERVKRGTYSFAEYDFLTSNLTSLDVVPYYILDYANNLYNGGLAPSTDESRNAFANYAGNATLHFKGRNIIWEMWNEPDLPFWTPEPKVEDYVALAKVVGQRIKSVAPQEVYVGPTIPSSDKTFLVDSLSTGVLEYFDAVSLHPYRGTYPERAYDEYKYTRSVIRKYKPANKPHIGILSGEWGYTTNIGSAEIYGRNVTEEQQAQYVVREFMTNMMYDVPISIWYDFKDDGEDPTEQEHRFGLFRFDYVTPKPSAQATINFFTLLRKLSYNKRLLFADSAVYVTLFADADEPTTVVVVAWTTADSSTISIPVTNGQFDRINMYGNSTSTVTASNNVLQITVSKSPVYFKPKSKNDFLWFLAGIKRLPVEVAGKYGNVSLPFFIKNTFSSAQTISLGPDSASVAPGQTAFFFADVFNDIQNSEAIDAKFAIQVAGYSAVTLGTSLVCDYPIIVSLTIPSSSSIPVLVYTETSFQGSVEVTSSSGTVTVPVSISAGNSYSLFNAALNPGNTSDVYSLSYTIYDANKIVAGRGSNSYSIMDNLSNYAAGQLPSKYFTYDAQPSVTGTFNATIGVPSDGAPSTNVNSFKFTYSFSSGYKYVLLLLRQKQLIKGNFTTIGMWIYGDESGNTVRVRLIDSTDQYFQASFPVVTWKGWRFVKMIDLGHWGGANDGVVHYPAYWETAFLLDSNQAGSSGVLYTSSPMAIY